MPEHVAEIETSPSQGGGDEFALRAAAREKQGEKQVGQAKGKPAVDSGLAAEQTREARETNQAKNAEGSIRDRMVDIGRGNQQAGRQGAK